MRCESEIQRSSNKPIHIIMYVHKNESKKDTSKLATNIIRYKIWFIIDDIDITATINIIIITINTTTATVTIIVTPINKDNIDNVISDVTFPLNLKTQKKTEKKERKRKTNCYFISPSLFEFLRLFRLVESFLYEPVDDYLLKMVIMLIHET